MGLEALSPASVPGWDTILRYKSSLTQVTFSSADFGRSTPKSADASCVDWPLKLERAWVNFLRKCWAGGRYKDREVHSQIEGRPRLTIRLLAGGTHCSALDHFDCGRSILSESHKSHWHFADKRSSANLGVGLPGCAYPCYAKRYFLSGARFSTGNFPRSDLHRYGWRRDL